MGRQVYLTRLAFGRSAFEPADPRTVSFPVIGEHEQNDDDEATSEESPQPYVQLYDSRGHPVNHRSRELGRQMREAQNDVLAAIGAVERKGEFVDDDASDSEEEIPLTTEEREDAYGEIIWGFWHYTSIPLSWWFSALKSRLLIESNARRKSFTDILCTVFQGHSLTVLRAYPTYNLENFMTALPWDHFSDSLPYYLRLSRSQTAFLQRFLRKTSAVLLPLEILLSLIDYPRSKYPIAFIFSPLGYHSQLVQLGLQTSTFAPREAWSPGSPLSPLPTFRRSWQGFLLSPFIIRALTQALTVNVIAPLYYSSEAAIASNIIQPRNPGGIGLVEQRSARNGPRLSRYSPLLSRALSFLGWGHASPAKKSTHELPRRRISVYRGPPPDEASQRPTRQDTPPPLAPRQDENATQLDGGPGQMTFTNADFEIDPDGSSPTVRIALRDITPGRSDDEPYRPITMGFFNDPIDIEEEESEPHRVTELSLGPSKLLAHIVHRFLFDLCIQTPILIVSCGFNILYFTHTPSPDAAGQLGPSPLHTLEFWRNFAHSLEPGLVINLVNNVALCMAVDYSAKAALWAGHLGLTIWEGKRAFRWGEL